MTVGYLTARREHGGVPGSHTMSQEFKMKLRTSTREKIKRFDNLRGEFQTECPLSLLKVCFEALGCLVIKTFGIPAEPVLPVRKTHALVSHLA